MSRKKKITVKDLLDAIHAQCVYCSGAHIDTCKIAKCEFYALRGLKPEDIECPKK